MGWRSLDSSDWFSGFGFLIIWLSLALSGLAFILSLVFFILKVTGNLGWSYWAVWSPLLVTGSGLVVGIILIVIGAITGGRSSNRRRNW